MSSDQSKPSRSPILAAIGISWAIAAGSIVATTDWAAVEDIVTGKALTRPLAEAQERNALAIATLQNTVGAMSRDIDFVAERVSATIRRGEDQTIDRFAHLDAEITALKDKIAGVQLARLAPARATEDPGRDTTGLRSSLHDGSPVHSRAVAAITRRLDRIELKIGLTTDAPVASALARQAKKRPTSAEADANPTQPEQGHIFDLKPISHQGAPLRLSRLPG
jgi:hypothetical protein